MNKLRFKFAYPVIEEGTKRLKIHVVDIAETADVTTNHGEVGGTAVVGALVMNGSNNDVGYERLSNAVAVCSPKDEYSFEFGCKKVVERLLDNAHPSWQLTKGFRATMWTSYFDAMKRYRSQV